MLEGDIGDNPLLFALWNWLLYSAAWKSSSIIWNGVRRDIQPGTVVMGLRELSERWECSPSTIKRWLQYLVRSERISLESCTRGTLITILNWEVYQSKDESGGTRTAHELHTACTRPAHELHLSEESKKVRREESPLTPQGVGECLSVWAETLTHFGIARDTKRDEVQIARLIQAHGIEATKAALRGARFEAKTDSFDPKRHVSIFRVSKPANFDKFVNLGAQTSPDAPTVSDYSYLEAEQ